MPIYEYRCEACGLSFDRLERLGGAGAAPCPRCGVPAERLVSRVAGRPGDCGPGAFT